VYRGPYEYPGHHAQITFVMALKTFGVAV
jgi:hypothetical protein